MEVQIIFNTEKYIYVDSSSGCIQCNHSGLCIARYLAFFILPDPSWIQYMDNILSTLNSDAEGLLEHYMEKA